MILWGQLHLIHQWRYILVLYLFVQCHQNTSITMFSIWRGVMKFSRREMFIDNKVCEVCKITFGKKWRWRHLPISCISALNLIISNKSSWKALNSVLNLCYRGKPALTCEHNLSHTTYSVKNNSFKNDLHLYQTEWIVSFPVNFQICSPATVYLRFIFYILL